MARGKALAALGHSGVAARAHPRRNDVVVEPVLDACLVVVGLAAVDKVGSQAADQELDNAGRKHRYGQPKQEADELVQKGERKRAAVFVNVVDHEAKQDDEENRDEAGDDHELRHSHSLVVRERLRNRLVILGMHIQ